MYLDDMPVKPNQTLCDADYKCSWDSLYEFMKSRQFSDVIQNGYNTNNTRNFCFSHLNYEIRESTYEENLPWWLAFVIAVPLVGITLALIKIVMIVRNKRKRESLQRQRGEPGYNRLN